MSLRNRRNRERRQRVLSALGHTAKWLLVLGALGGIGLMAHRTGSELARVETSRLAEELAGARGEVAALRGEVETLRTERDAARAQVVALQEQYDRDVPTGALATLLGEVRNRLEGGLSEERLRQVVAVAAPVKLCDGPAVVRRFRIGAGERAGPEDGTNFLDGLLRVEATAPAGFEGLARTMVVTFSGVGLEGPVRTTGVPATQVFRLGHLEVPMTVTVSPIAGFAQASVPTCRPE